jgi:hypothetical protein
MQARVVERHPSSMRGCRMPRLPWSSAAGELARGPAPRPGRRFAPNPQPAPRPDGGRPGVRSQGVVALSQVGARVAGDGKAPIASRAGMPGMRQTTHRGARCACATLAGSARPVDRSTTSGADRRMASGAKPLARPTRGWDGSNLRVWRRCGVSGFESDARPAHRCDGAGCPCCSPWGRA